MSSDIKGNDEEKQYINSYYVEPEWIVKNNINPNLFLYYEKIYIIQLEESNKVFVGTLLSIEESICNFSDLENSETMSLMFEYNEEFSSMIILQEYKNKESNYKIKDIYIIDEFNPVKSEYNDYEEIDFIEETVKKKNYTKTIIKDDLLSFFINELDILNDAFKINIIRNLTDEIYQLINSESKNLLDKFEWLEHPIKNLMPQAFIPIIDGKRPYLPIGIFDGQTELANFIDNINNLTVAPYTNKIKLMSSWLDRIIPNSTPVINEYYGIAHLDYLNEELKINDDKISISKIIEIPLDKLLYSPKMTLFEKISTYNIYNHNIHNISNYTTHDLNGGNWPDIIKHLGNVLPSIDNFIDNLIDEDVMNYVLNVDDLSFILHKYSITIDQLTKSNREKIYKKITSNCERYAESLPKKYTTLLKSLKKNSINNTKRVELSKKYIFSQIQDNYTKQLLKKFINTYTRNSDKITESNLWYYNIFNDEKILCKHYQYFVEITNDNDMFNTMVDRFGSNPIDGCVFCKNCGEFICLEEFSTFSGFKDDAPIIQSAAGESKDENIDIIDDPINDKIIALIDLFSTLFSITIDDKFKVDLIDIYLYIDSKLLSSIRYNENDISIKPIHPRIIDEFDDINKEIEKTKKKSERKELEHYKNDIFESFQLWLHDSNRFMSVLIIFIILNQTKSLSAKKNMEILDVKTRDINPKMLVYMKSKIFKNIEFMNDKRLDYLKLFVSDEKLSCNDFEKQLTNSIDYIKNLPLVLQKYNNYLALLQTQQHTYLREEWTLFKPLRDNILIRDVRNLINSNIQSQFLLKKYGNYKVENISLIRPLTQKTSIGDLCKIPRLEIIQNSAFIQFLRLCTSCYGIHPSDPYIDLLIDRIIDTLDNPKIKEIFSKYKKNDLDFNLFRNKLIPNILKLYPNQNDNYIIRSCFDDEESCNELIHISINTYDLSLLNTYPKRFYYYELLNVFPNNNLDYYTKYNQDNPDNKSTLVDKLFDHYGVNSINDIDVYHHFVFLAQDKIFEDSHSILKPLPINSDNFKSLLHIKTVYPKIPIHIYPPTINRLDRSLQDILNLKLNSKDSLEYLKHTLDNILNDANPAHITEQMKAVFSDIISNMTNTISKISSYLTNCRWITNEQIQKFSKLINGEFNNTTITQFLQKFIMDTNYTSEYIKIDITHIKYVFIDILNTHALDLPKEWKLSDGIDSQFFAWLQRSSGDDYMDTKASLLLHDRVFLYGSSDNYPGFNQYLNSKHIKLLFDHIRGIFENLDNFIGDDSNFYNTLYSNIMCKNILLEIFYLIIQYLENIQDTVSDISTDANELFIQLNISEEEFKQESIDICSRFLMDLLNDLLLSHYDPSWIYQNKTKSMLNNRLSKQREREKLLHLSRLTDVTKDQRYIADQKQKLGLSNMWKQGAEDCKKFVNSEEAATLNEAERKERLDDILEASGVTPSDFQVINLSINPSEDMRELEEGYDYQEDLDEDDDPDQGLYDEEQEPVNNI